MIVVKNPTIEDVQRVVDSKTTCGFMWDGDKEGNSPMLVNAQSVKVIIDASKNLGVDSLAFMKSKITDSRASFQALVGFCWGR